MKKFIKLLLIFILFFKSDIFSFYDISFINYPRNSSILFTHPAAVGLLNRFNIEFGYGVVLKNLLENNLYTSGITSSVNFKNIFFGLGYNALVLENIYSEEIFIFNFGSFFFNRKLILASNIRYYIFKYIYDEYYEEDPLKNEQFALYNFDFGILWNLNNFVISLSGINLYDNKLGENIKYTLPKKFIFNLSYKYNNDSNISFETQFSEEVVDQKIKNILDYKLGIVQKIFSSKIISCDILATFKKSKDFTGFSLSFYNKFISNKLGVKYVWYYPITEIQNFLGNHYVILDFEFGEKTLAEKKTIKKEVYKETQETKKETLTKPELEMEEKPTKEKPQIKEVQISTPSVETKDIKKQTLTPQTTSLQILSIEEKRKEELTPQKTHISTTALPSVPKEEPKEKSSPKVLKPSTSNVSQPYKFPLAHKVKEGETLVSISKKYYNTEKNWKKIYEANKDKIIKGVPIVGEILIIPEP